MDDEDPITKSDFNTLMSQMAAMMVEIQGHKTQLEALASGTSSTTPPAPVDSLDKPLLNEDDPKKVDDVEGDEDTKKKGNTPTEHSSEIPPLVSYVSGRSKCHILLHAVLHHLLMLLALPIGKIICALT
jgi:hypothetical protein